MRSPFKVEKTQRPPNQQRSFSLVMALSSRVVQGINWSFMRVERQKEKIGKKKRMGRAPVKKQWLLFIPCSPSYCRQQNCKGSGWTSPSSEFSTPMVARKCPSTRWLSPFNTLNLGSAPHRNFFGGHFVVVGSAASTLSSQLRQNRHLFHYSLSLAWGQAFYLPVCPVLLSGDDGEERGLLQAAQGSSPTV